MKNIADTQQNQAYNAKKDYGKFLKYIQVSG